MQSSCSSDDFTQESKDRQSKKKDPLKVVAERMERKLEKERLEKEKEEETAMLSRHEIFC